LTERDIPVAVHVPEPKDNAVFGIRKVLNADRTQSSAY
jgi:hypothetical protein